MVHFFLYDYRFERVWEKPDSVLDRLYPYCAVLTPDFSMYLEMNPVLQLYNVFRNRWCGAYWASKGLRVIPTVNWGDTSTFDFCFEGIEKGSVVAVSTYMASAHGNRSDQKEWFLTGYSEMLRRIKPEKIICYHTPFPEMEGNIIPYIGGEEEKSEKEPLRVLGTLENGEIKLAEEPKITCQCLRVPVLNGHTAAVFINFEKKPTKEQLIEKLESFKGFPQEADLPSAPKQFIQYLSEDDRPQVKADVNYENGMGVSIGRLREDSMYDYKFIGLSHNTVRGAAGGAVLCAEALTAKGYIQAK